jgi:hypothetical protein
VRIEVRHRNASRDVLGRPDLTQDAAPRVRRGEQDGIEVQLARRDHLEVAEQGGAFLKHVVVPSVLQDKSVPNVATEFGVLLPDSNGDSGVGASSAGIVSQRWDWGTVHFNAETALTREHHTDFFCRHHHPRANQRPFGQ